MLIITALFLIAIKLTAQSENKIRYYLLPQVALLNGDHATSGQFQVIGGIQKKRWSAGIGTAFDYYKLRTVPMFVDMRAWFGKKHSIFSYADLGTNIAWPINDTDKTQYGTGFYADMGLGYAFHGEKKGGLVISVGYSIKTITESVRETVYKEFPPYGLEIRERTLNYSLNRLAFRLGIRL